MGRATARVFFLSGLACLALAVEGRAQVLLKTVEWKLLPAKRERGAQAPTISRLIRPPEAVKPPALTLGASVTVTNAGGKAAVGVLVRYAVWAKIAPAGTDALEVSKETTGTWAVPFWLEEKHIPKIAAGKEASFLIPNLHVEDYLKQLRREGYWPVAFRLQVMAEPKKGEELAGKILEAEIPVIWKEAAAK